MKTKLTLAALCILASSVQAETLLLQEPSIAQNKIAFVYAGDIYVSNKQGQQVTRITSHAANEYAPHLSPDGQWIAFTADYEGNNDVYIVSATGGQPKRLTWHPGTDEVRGWSADGKSVLFTSRRDIAHNRTGQLFSVAIQGGFPTKVMEAVVSDGKMNADGSKLAYNPERLAHGGKNGWRNHRGGTTPPVWIYDLNKNSYVEVPHGNFSDSSPMWVGEDIYFISDRSKHKNIYSFKQGQVEQVTHFNQWDVANANAFGSDIVFEKGGAIFLLDTLTGNSKQLNIDIQVDLPQRRTQFKDAMPSLSSSQISATGKQVLLSARGEVFSVPVKDGSTYNLTNTSGQNERDALWSPLGEQIAYITDKGGDYRLVLADQFGEVQKTLDLGKHTADFSLFSWMPDGKHIVFGDSNMALWLIELKSGKKTKVMKNIAMTSYDVVSSPDSKWLAYTRNNTNYLRDLYLYNIKDKSHHKITDGMSDNAEPVFSPDGQYLYFASSTNKGLTAFGLDLSSQERPQRYGLYAAVLQQDGQSPLMPKLADEAYRSVNGSQDKDEEEADDSLPSIDIKGLSKRIVALPVPQRNYWGLTATGDNNLYFIEGVQIGSSIELDGKPLRSSQLKRFNFEERKVDKVADKIESVTVSADGKQLLLVGEGNALSTATVAEKVEVTPLNTADVKARINPTQEWAQIFDEAWRNERDYFYDPKMHGLDWQGVYDKYQPLLKHVGRREDLNNLMREMISEMQVGHNYIIGGDVHREETMKVGLLGADFEVKNGLYRIKNIYTGEAWNPHLKAPLAVPGNKVSVGDYILEVDGQPVDASINLYSLFVGKVDKQVRLTVSPNGKAKKAHTLVVEPIKSEFDLRHWHWIEDNHNYVTKATGGKVGYVYLPNTTTAGYTSFNRMFFAQVDRKGVILDERSNGGGQAANYIIDVLNRQYLSGWKYRSGDMVYDTPAGAIYGPKVMLIDQDAGSGGDFLPYAFKRLELGTLVGKTTWGGLIGISANRDFIDGGRVTVPNFRFFTPDHEWRVENEGVAPDIEVELDPVAVNKGQDPQLDRAIKEVQQQLKSFKPVRHDTPPAFPTELGR
ncbi:S41 family peptidase [Shewanella woodyi]|uniref:S41 family peptidase n=1 Tax=Shewanella woodyi TaxID=60961 RepID=UPI0037492774